MAQRRMISLSLIDTDKFNEMKATSRLLYYELSLRADDDGVVSSPKKITRMIGCSQSDLDQLIENGYIISFESGVVVIKHWKINNQIRKDRYTPSIFQTELSMLADKNNVYYLKSDSCPPEGCDLVTACQPDGCESAPQDSIGKVSIDKISEDKDSTEERIPPSENGGSTGFEHQSVIDLFNNICISLNKAANLTDERIKAVNSAKARLKTVSFEELFRRVEASDFLTGRSSDWKCSFDWILKPANLQKILEGNYDNSSLSKTKHKLNPYAIDYDELEKYM